MKKILVSLMVLVALSSLNGMYAQKTQQKTQQKTAYEKRIEQIQKEAARKLGYSDVNSVVVTELFNGSLGYYTAPPHSGLIKKTNHPEL